MTDALKKLIALCGLAHVIAVAGCSGGASAGALPLVSPTPAPAANERYVTIGFWNSSVCEGAPVSTNRFPVHYGDRQCYTWPGRSGENSATRFACGSDSLSYTQWTTLTCSGGQNPQGTRKTTNLTDCTQDLPPTLYARIVDFSGCTP